MKHQHHSVLIFVCVSLILGISCDSLTKSSTPPEAASDATRESLAPERGFISSIPAETWEQGLITANGTIGASVLSHPLDETIVFSHERMFLPERDPIMPPLTAPRLFEIRRLILRGLYRQAEQLTFDISEQEGFLYPDCLFPAFDLKIRMDRKGKVTDYLRSVDFQTGEATVHWSDTRGVFERRLFVSRADGVAVLLVSGPGAGTVNCRLRLEPRDSQHERFRRNITDLETTVDGSALTFRNSFANAYPGSIHSLEGVTRVVARGGSTEPRGDALEVKGAEEVLIFMDIDVNYDPNVSRIEEMLDRLSELPAEYEMLLGRHARIHGEMFNRMRLDLGGAGDRGLTTEELMDKTSDNDPSRALIEKEFDAGRYNIISSTGDLPPTLQGVWAGTYSPPWASDFTHNGNVPSALASMLMGNMPELLLAYTSYIESIVPYLEINARRIFGARGVVLPSRSTTDGFNNSFNARFPGAFWVAGAAWAAHFFYDYFLYTGDRDFLAGHALPFMEKAALFFEDYLIEGPDGKFMFIPCQSPENAPNNTRSQATYNATMDVAAAKELFHSLISASRELEVNQEKIPVWQEMLAKMPEYLINEDGAVKEWLTPVLEDNYNHRHSSQLYALYDGLPEEIARDSKLQAGFKRVIELKLERYWNARERKRGFMSFGLVQLGQAATSLGDSGLAYQSLVPLINDYWYPSLASTHNYKALFNMDISGGMPAVIIKMLVDSQPGRIRLFPALPDAWPTGTIEGVLCRNQVMIRSLHWEDREVRVSLISGRDQQITVGTPSAIDSFSSSEGDASIQKTGEYSLSLSLRAEQEVTLDLLLN
jgi:hypothetical protein